MAEEAGSELVAIVREHLKKAKQALSSRSNMDKTLKGGAVHPVSELDSLLNKLEACSWITNAFFPHDFVSEQSKVC